MRSLFSRAALAVAAAVALLGAGFAQDQPGKPTGAREGKGSHAGAFEHCAKACNDCGRACDACGAHCAELIAKGHKEHLATLQTCQDCATHCAAAACITARQGPFTDLICKACAEACKSCGEACEQHKQDPVMRRCAEECRRCERACKEMLKHTDQGRVGRSR